MSEDIGFGVIGLGVMGQRMLARIVEHPRSRALAVWDPDARREGGDQGTLSRGSLAAQTPAEVIGAAGLHCLYVASPPVSHLAYAEQAFDAGLAVFCEKPLTVDFDAARRSIARIERQKLRAAVNFSLASSPGLAAMAAAVKDGSIGAPRAVEIEVAFDQWPRAWQSAAGRWLAERAEGGFTREVLSHFVFVLQRALGPAIVESSRPDYPPDGVGAERAIEARLSAGGVPVTVQGRVGGSLPDFNRMTLLRKRRRGGDPRLVRPAQAQRRCGLGRRAQPAGEPRDRAGRAAGSGGRDGGRPPPLPAGVRRGPRSAGNDRGAAEGALAPAMPG